MLGLPSTTAELLQPTNRGSSGTDFVAAGSGVAISEIFYQDKTGVLNGERLGVEHNVWFEFSKMATLVDVKRGDKLLINIAKLVNVAIASILWQSGTTVRLAFESTGITQKISVGDYVVFTTATNSANNGTFIVTAVTATYIEFLNAARTSNTLDEATSPAILTKTLAMYEVVDIKKQIFSEFKDHYELNILSPND